MSQPASEEKRRRLPLATHPRARGILAVLIVVLLVFGVVTYVAYRHLNGNINQIDVASALGNHRPPVQQGPINVLVMGDDSRVGQTGAAGIGGYSPGNSDTTILLHVSADHTRAYGVSIPRDTMVQRPSCVRKNGKGTAPAGLTQFNQAYEIGGPACTIKTMEAITGIRMQHFLVVNFNGFRDMVNALGGVQVCVPHAVNDPVGNIHLPAGTYDVTGDQALSYVRERHAFGDGSDIGRMKRQQAFVASMVHKAVSAGTLANPKKLYGFLDAATKSLTTDPDFANVLKLASLAQSVQSIGMDHINFLTAPWRLYPQDPNRLQLAPSARRLWRELRQDRPVSQKFLSGALRPNSVPGTKSKAGKGSAGSPSAGPSASSSPTTGSTTSPEQKAQNEANGLCS